MSAEAGGYPLARHNGPVIVANGADLHSIYEKLQCLAAPIRTKGS